MALAQTWVMAISRAVLNFRRYSVNEGEGEMKNNIKNLTKRFAAGILVVAMAVAGMVVVPRTVEAADTRTIQWVEYSNDDFKALYNANKTAPTYTGADKAEGYVFGGWYTAKEGTAHTTTTAAEATGNVWAKFVPSYVLNVKAQNKSETYKENDGITRTDVRVVASVDSTKYSEVGFVYDAGNKGVENKVVCEKVFKYLYEGESKTYPTDLMGAKAQYFVSHRFTRIKETSFASTIYVRPYWVTLDGTTVQGLGKYIHIEDGQKGYITVPVNLKEASAIAAGVAEITYDNTKVEFVDYEEGRVFEEMKAADKGSSVKVVGNVETITADAGNPNDIFVSLRFKPIDPDANLNTTLNFDIKTKDFCDRLEATKEFNIWNIKY